MLDIEHYKLVGEKARHIKKALYDCLKENDVINTSKIYDTFIFNLKKESDDFELYAYFPLLLTFKEQAVHYAIEYKLNKEINLTQDIICIDFGIANKKDGYVYIIDNAFTYSKNPDHVKNIKLYYDNYKQLVSEVKGNENESMVLKSKLNLTNNSFFKNNLITEFQGHKIGNNILHKDTLSYNYNGKGQININDSFTIEPVSCYQFNIKSFCKFNRLDYDYKYPIFFNGEYFNITDHNEPYTYGLKLDYGKSIIFFEETYLLLLDNNNRPYAHPISNIDYDFIK